MHDLIKHDALLWLVVCCFFFNSSNWCISILAEKLHFDPCQVITKVEAPIRQLNTKQEKDKRKTTN